MTTWMQRKKGKDGGCSRRRGRVGRDKKRQVGLEENRVERWRRLFVHGNEARVRSERVAGSNLWLAALPGHSGSCSGASRKHARSRLPDAREATARCVAGGMLLVLLRVGGTLTLTLTLPLTRLGLVGLLKLSHAKRCMSEMKEEKLEHVEPDGDGATCKPRCGGCRCGRGRRRSDAASVHVGQVCDLARSQLGERGLGKHGRVHVIDIGGAVVGQEDEDLDEWAVGQEQVEKLSVIADARVDAGRRVERGARLKTRLQRSGSDWWARETRSRVAEDASSGSRSSCWWAVRKTEARAATWVACACT
ncbi:hypothetical protein BCR44DRAFT_1009786 [Catenaria anguillulae PL171]|uniref:Uncharacterized protein n=1 Tax=Catenaria anguillulae PL171 TaxID=765915 RepID=A0A1Y2I3Z4_9FUNG|nr:hypothetical protein BCR44DRAFT_1009786 [Catenaria anguillulae PL171]